MRVVNLCAVALLSLGAATPAGAAQSAAEIEAMLRAQGAGAGVEAGANRSLGVAPAEPQAPAAGASVSRSPAEQGRKAATPRASAVALRPDDPPVVPDGQRIDLPITFETNSAVLRPEAGAVLTELCGALQKVMGSNPAWTFNIVGHADASGTASHNLRLSAARAREVKRHLVDECGVPAARLETFGLGNTRPLPGVPPVSEQNRRVEVSVNAV